MYEHFPTIVKDYIQYFYSRKQILLQNVWPTVLVDVLKFIKIINNRCLASREKKIYSAVTEFVISCILFSRLCIVSEISICQQNWHFVLVLFGVAVFQLVLCLSNRERMDLLNKKK